MAKRDFILHNFYWKLFSLFLAALTWFTIQTAFEKDQTLRAMSTRKFPEVPITMMTEAGSTNQFRVVPATVAIEISGKAGDVEALQQNHIMAFVDLTEIGEAKFIRKEILVQAPGDFKVINITPTYANINRLTVTN